LPAGTLGHQREKKTNKNRGAKIQKHLGISKRRDSLETKGKINGCNEAMPGNKSRGFPPREVTPKEEEREEESYNGNAKKKEWLTQ